MGEKRKKLKDVRKRVICEIRRKSEYKNNFRTIKIINDFKESTVEKSECSSNQKISTFKLINTLLNKSLVYD